MSILHLREVRSGESHEFMVRRLLVAGFTGRDSEAVDTHVAELAAEGVPVPETTPSLYRLDPSLAVQTEQIHVEGANTSGEVEPVIVVADRQWLLTVGSDHTDRTLEREDIAESKAACPKILGSTGTAVDAIDNWDRIELESRIDGGVVYQRGRLGSLLPLQDIIDWLAQEENLTLDDGDVLFLGTVPADDGIRPASRFSASLRVPEHDVEFELDYRIETGG